MTEPLVTPETAALAKQAGFDWPVTLAIVPEMKSESGIPVRYSTAAPANLNKYEHYVSAPTQCHLQMWLREVKNYHIGIDFCGPTGYLWERKAPSL